MSLLTSVTPVILTLNEAANIGRSLSALNWASEIVVVDSGSQDTTAEIVRGFGNARLVHRPFDTHASQWNFAVSETGISTEWVLALDADYVVDEPLVEELRGLVPRDDVAGYEAGFTYCVFGRPLRGSLYPPVTVLFRRAKGVYVQDGHTQRISLNGRVEKLRNRVLHDDRKPLREWLAAQNRYMALEAEKLLNSGAHLAFPDRVRKIAVFAPFLAFFYALVAKGALLDGRAGWYYAFQRMVAEGVLSLHLLQRSLRRR